MTFFDHVRDRLIATAAGVACMVVAVVAAGVTAYDGFRLLVPDVYASGLTALVFLGLAVGLLLALNAEGHAVHRPEPPPEPKSKLSRWSALAGEVAIAFLSGAAASRRGRGK